VGTESGIQSESGTLLVIDFAIHSISVEIPAIQGNFAPVGKTEPMQRPDESVSGFCNRSYERALAHSFCNLGERVFFQFLCVTVEFADAFGQLFRRHGIFVVHPAKIFLAEVQALVFALLGCRRV